MSSDSEATSKKPTKDAEVKSYWYPDRNADITEISSGYKKWRSDLRFSYVILISGLISMLAVLLSVQRTGFDHVYHTLKQQIDLEVQTRDDFWLSFASFIAGLIFLIFAITVYLLKKKRNVYLIDFTTYEPAAEYKVPHELFMERSRDSGFFDTEGLEFQEKLLYRTGLGNETYFPAGILAQPPDTTMQRARDEAMGVMSGCLDELFARTGLKPTDVDILIVNCSLFNPTPSLSAMVINKYKMRSDIKNYTLSGMGCSAGVISIDLAKDLLQAHKNCNCVVISTENITQNWYTGLDKSMLISNTLFRMGGAAILLSNKWGDRWNAKFRLECTVRVHKGAIDRAYHAVYQKEDAQGKKGVALSKELLDVAGDALKSNLTILGPMVLPWSEQIKFFFNLLWRKAEMNFVKDRKKRTPPYVPDFKKAFQHFCIHAGGRAIIDGLEENLKLEPHHIEPSRATLYRYGNTSASSIWYEMMFIERSGRMKKGDKVFQIALGSGFKCNSAVWKRI